MGATAPRCQPRLGADPRDTGFRAGMWVLLFTIIFLPKFGIVVGSFELSLSLPVLYLVLSWQFLYRTLSVSPARLVLLLLFFGVALLSQIGSRGVSILSILFLAVIYVPFVAVWRIGRADWRWVMGVFQNMMLVPSGMVFVQLFWQLVLHQKDLSIEPLIPHFLALQGFMYEGPVHWGQPLMRPNGFFMLEPSYISAYSACALILEATEFRRTWRLCWYAAAMLASTGATGLVMTAAALPFILAAQRREVLILALPALLVIGAIVIGTGHAGAFTDRVSEFGNQESSGFGRLVAPLIQLGELTRDPRSLVIGAGAGQITAATSIVSSAWPMAKLAVEYGFLTMSTFMLLLGVCCWGAPTPAITAALFVMFNFTGGYLQQPITTILVFVLATSLRLQAVPCVYKMNYSPNLHIYKMGSE